MSTTETALTAHLTVLDTPRENRLLSEIAEELQRRFDIDHTTLQLELVEAEYFCPLETAHAIGPTAHQHVS
jgi:cobalt-zinc-cadmium efflux system protein